MEKKKKAPWAPTQEQKNQPEQKETGTIPLPIFGAGVGTKNAKNDPSLEQIIQSMVKLSGGKRAVANERRYIARHLTPKARRHKKVRRKMRNNARRANPSNRGARV